MPYKSQAQAGYFHTHKAQLEKQGVNVAEWDAASKGKKLPKRVGKGTAGRKIAMPKRKNTRGILGIPASVAVAPGGTK